MFSATNGSPDIRVLGKVKMKINKLGSVLLQSVCLLVVTFAVLIIAASIALMIPSCAGKFAHGYVMRVPLGGVVSYGLVISVLWMILEYCHRKWGALFERLEVVVLMLWSFLISLFFIKLLPSLVYCENNMAWDSLMVLKSINAGKICFFHPIRNQYWCNYEILNSIIGVIFNGGLSACRVFQAMACAVTVFPVFSLSMQIAGRKIARVVALLLAMSPTLIMYSMLPTSEFLSASLLMFSAYFLIKGFNQKKLGFVGFLYVLLAGVFWGLSDLFKTISVVVLVTASVILIIYFCYFGWKCGLRIMMILIMFVLVSSVARQSGQIVLAELAQTPKLINSSESMTSTLQYELALGLDVEYEGFWNKKLALDFLKMSKECQHKFVEDAVARNWKQYPMLMIRKFRNIHGSDCYHHGAVRQFISVFRDQKGRYRPPSWVVPIADIGTVFFKVFFLLGAIGLFMSRKQPFMVVLPGLFAALIILLFAGIEQLIEGHGRYKTAIYPFYFMILPYVCVWFEKDNPVYVRLAKWGRELKFKLKGRENEC